MLSQDISLTLNSGSAGDLEQSKDAPGPTATLILTTEVPQKLVSQRKNANLPRAAVFYRREGWNDACPHLECPNRTDSLPHLIIIIYSLSKQGTASNDFGFSDLNLGSFCTLFQAEIKRFACWSPNLGSC